MERKQSKFMIWGGQNEAVITHIVVWSLMCATKEGEAEYGGKLNDYSKDILFFLLFGKDYHEERERYSIKNIKIWREWKRIDALAEITLENTDKEEKKYALFIELKAYSHTSEKQLESYKAACEICDYKNKGVEEKFILLGAWDDCVPEEDKAYCKNFDFVPCTFQDILDEVFLKGKQTFESSGNEIFDEFWAGYW